MVVLLEQGYGNKLLSNTFNTTKGNGNAIVSGLCNYMCEITNGCSNNFIGGGACNCIKTANDESIIGGGLKNTLCYTKYSHTGGGCSNLQCYTQNSTIFWWTDKYDI